MANKLGHYSREDSYTSYGHQSYRNRNCHWLRIDGYKAYLVLYYSIRQCSYLCIYMHCLIRIQYSLHESHSFFYMS